MKKCANCGAINEKNDKYCRSCGVILHRVTYYLFINIIKVIAVILLILTLVLTILSFILG